MEKMSYFDVGRGLTRKEFKELGEWLKNNADKRWTRRDIHPKTKMFFDRYISSAINGERWTSLEEINLIDAKQREKRLENREDVLLRERSRQKEWRSKNPEKTAAKAQRYRKSENGKEKNRLYQKEYMKNRESKDPLFKMAKNIRNLIGNSFSKFNFQKGTKTEKILGLSFDEFKEYLESLFEPWMNWENRGGKIVTEINSTWDIDHIVPLSTAKTEEDLIGLNHYSNLRPMCSYANRFLKKDKLNWEKDG